VVDALGRSAEAVLLYQEALARDAGFAEAWVNIASIQEGAGRALDAEVNLSKALNTRPDFGPALYNLARLLTKVARFNEALPLWDRYLALRPLPDNVSDAIKLRGLCRLARAETSIAVRGT
jgi:tetratricopeptide (TPR) repeat protein